MQPEAPSPRLPKAAGRHPVSAYLLPAAVIAAVALLLFYFLASDNNGKGPARQETRSKLPPTATDSTATSPKPSTPETAASATKPADRPEPAEALPVDGLVLRLKAITDGKVHINIDGSVSQEYDLVTGDLVEWKADKSFQLDLENAGSVEGELNGKPLKPFGENGRAAHLTIRQDGVHHE